MTPGLPNCPLLDLRLGDCRAVLPILPSASAQCCVTSPPYWGLRSYLPDGHANKASEIGAEATPEAYISALVVVFREVWRVLRDDGTLWLNLGDCYARSGGMGGCGPNADVGNTQSGQQRRNLVPPLGLKAKDLVGIPWRVALALQADGWWLRSDIIWHKPNSMPESVTDRPTRSHEYIFLLAKQERYFYDMDAIAEPMGEASRARYDYAFGGKKNEALKEGDNPTACVGNREKPTTRNKRDVWTVSPANYPEAHFATFPPDLIKPCILAGSRHGDTVLDPFGGSGTTAEVAISLGRRATVIELNEAYQPLIESRTATTIGLPFNGHQPPAATRHFRETAQTTFAL